MILPKKLIGKTLKTLALAGLVTSALLTAQSANAAKFDFSYSGEKVYADGVLTATDLGGGKFQVTDITGERNGAIISSLIPSGSLFNDNLIFPSQSSVVDSKGFAFQAGNKVSVSSSGSGYTDFSLNSDRRPISTALNSLKITPFKTPTSLINVTFTHSYIGLDDSGKFTGVIQTGAKFLTLPDLTALTINISSSLPELNGQQVTLANVQSFCKQLADVSCPNGADADITYLVNGLPFVITGDHGTNVISSVLYNGQIFPETSPRIQTVSVTSTSVPEPSSVGGSVAMAGFVGAFLLRKKLTSRPTVAVGSD